MAIVFATSLGSLKSLSTKAVVICYPAWCAAVNYAALPLREQRAPPPPAGSSSPGSVATPPPFGISSLAASRASGLESSSRLTAPYCRSCPGPVWATQRSTDLLSSGPRLTRPLQTHWRRCSRPWSSLAALPASAFFSLSLSATVLPAGDRQPQGGSVTRLRYHEMRFVLFMLSRL